MKLHGSEFRAYLKRVPRFFPKLSLLEKPTEYVTKPVVFRKHLFDALWFVWLIGIVEVIEELHRLKIFPIMFKVY